MSNIFFCSDHHFGHQNIIKFTRDNGDKLRSFNTLEHMQEYIIQKHNSVVQPGDKVYFLGDVCMTRTAEGLKILSRLNGEKILIRGNHDECKLSQYAEYFTDIRGVSNRYGVVMSHVPIHPDSLERWGFNMHGHLHYKRVLLPNGHPDPRYINVSMEQLADYTPLSLDELNRKITNAKKQLAMA
jgi:calcineurin-like phosphoesterase family protein